MWPEATGSDAASLMNQPLYWPHHSQTEHQAYINQSVTIQDNNINSINHHHSVMSSIQTNQSKQFNQSINHADIKPNRAGGRALPPNQSIKHTCYAGPGCTSGLNQLINQLSHTVGNLTSRSYLWTQSQQLHILIYLWHTRISVHIPLHANVILSKSTVMLCLPSQTV